MDNDHLYKGPPPSDLYSSSISCTVNGKCPDWRVKEVDSLGRHSVMSPLHRTSYLL